MKRPALDSVVRSGLRAETQLITREWPEPHIPGSLDEKPRQTFWWKI
jgi:hypothetical protein